MSDGNTAFQVSPATTSEEDMSALRRLFENAANTIVEASNLRKEVGEIRTQVETLRGQVDAFREENDRLNSYLGDTRRERDELKSKVVELEHTNYVLQNQLNSSASDYDLLKRDYDDGCGERDALRNERNDAQYRVMELEDENVRLKAKLAKFKALMEDGEVADPTPVPSGGSSGPPPSDLKTGETQSSDHNPEPSNPDKVWNEPGKYAF